MKALPWIAAALVALTVSAVAGGESAPVQPVSIETTVIPAGVCPRGHAGVWIEPGVMECLKELP